MAASHWTDRETSCLISTWSLKEYQTKLGDSIRNIGIFQQISERLNGQGVKRTGLQCREKIKKLKAEWRKLRDHNNKSGNKRKEWKYYDSIGAILGDDPTCDPNAVIESMDSVLDENACEMVLGSVDDVEDTSVMYHTVYIDRDDVDGGLEDEDTSLDIGTAARMSAASPSSAVTVREPSFTTTPTGDTSGAAEKSETMTTQKRKRGRPSHSSYMDKFLQMQEKFRDDLLSWEERQRQADAEMERVRQHEEREHEQRMFAMLLQAINAKK